MGCGSVLGGQGEQLSEEASAAREGRPVAEETEQPVRQANQYPRLLASKKSVRHQQEALNDLGRGGEATECGYDKIDEAGESHEKTYDVELRNERVHVYTAYMARNTRTYTHTYTITRRKFLFADDLFMSQTTSAHDCGLYIYFLMIARGIIHYRVCPGCSNVTLVGVKTKRISYIIVNTYYGAYNGGSDGLDVACDAYADHWSGCKTTQEEG